MRKYKISVLPGDGIGREVIPQAIRVLEVVSKMTRGFELSFESFECGGEYYKKTGKEWSEDAEEFTKKEADAILLGAVGASLPDGRPVRLSDGNLAGYSIVIALRAVLDLYANVRPVNLFEGVPTPLAEKNHYDIDMVIIRENTEGLYAPTRGILSRGGTGEVAIDARVITRKGAQRVSEFAFKEASRRDGCPEDGTKRVTCVDKSNLLAGCQLFREVFNQIAEGYPGITTDYAYVDAWTQWCLRKPEYYDVVVAPNEFGDIITDLGGAIQGGLGMAPAGNIGEEKGVFEPVHGSAPSHYGKNDANPIASILASSMLLDWLGTENADDNCIKAAEMISNSVKTVLKEGKIRTYDLCIQKWSNISPSSTSAVTDEIIRKIDERGGI